MYQTVFVHSLADLGLAQQIRHALFYDPGPDTAEDMLLTRPLYNDALNALQMQ
jgi:hypothetical protein